MHLLLTELRWWLRGTATTVRRAPGPIAFLIGLIWLVGVLVPTMATVGVTAAGLRAWWLASPRTFVRVTGPVRGESWRWRLRWNLPEMAGQCGLGDPEPPRILRTAVHWPHVRLVVRPSPGQTFNSYQTATEPLRHMAGAARIRVEPDAIRDVALTFTVADQLRHPFPAVAPRTVEDLAAVPVGRTESGTAWRLLVGPHTLVAGASGAGKGSVFWSFAFALAQAVHDGRVELHGIDLKGGMEILMGADLFTTTATDARAAVVSLERLVDLMHRRTLAYAGHTRSHTPTAEHPIHIVMVDELAALTAYGHDRELQRRAEAAINLLCSQGRAPGFMVFACLQDPRKEVIPSRGLFTQMVGLRLKDLTETAMVLGETALDAGAWCHRIIRDLPGTGFVVPEDGGPPLRVRAGHATDDAIRHVASTYPTPTRVELDVPAPDDDAWAPRRRSRQTGGLA